jgi:hypothetical protein
MGFVVDKVALGQVFSEYFGSSPNSNSTDYSTFIIIMSSSSSSSIYHPELV